MLNEPEEQLDLKPVIKALIWFTVCFAFGFVRYLGSSQGLWFWYQSLRRPSLEIPVWAYEPVWTVIFGLSAWASLHIWQSPTGKPRSLALGLFFSQLALSAFWPWMFYVGHFVGWSATIAAIYWATVIGTTVSFWRIKPGAGQTMLPNLIWVGFIACLNFVVWRLNR